MRLVSLLQLPVPSTVRCSRYFSQVCLCLVLTSFTILHLNMAWLRLHLWWVRLLYATDTPNTTIGYFQFLFLVWVSAFYSPNKSGINGNCTCCLLQLFLLFYLIIITWSSPKAAIISRVLPAIFLSSKSNLKITYNDTLLNRVRYSQKIILSDWAGLSRDNMFNLLALLQAQRDNFLHFRSVHHLFYFFSDEKIVKSYCFITVFPSN